MVTAPSALNLTPITSLMTVASVIGFLAVAQVMTWTVQVASVTQPASIAKSEKHVYSRRLKTLQWVGGLVLAMWIVGSVFASLILFSALEMTRELSSSGEDGSVRGALLIAEWGLIVMMLFGLVAFIVGAATLHRNKI